MNAQYEHPLIEKSVDKFFEAHPALAVSFSVGLWAGFAVLSGIHARKALQEGDRKEVVRGIAGAAGGAAVVAGAIVRNSVLENPLRFE